jgi:CBS domain-containing protein
LTDTFAQPDNKPDTKHAGRTSAGMSRLELRTEMARAICRPEPPMLGPETTLGEALAVMRERRGEALLVVDGARLMGILTERDVLRRVLGQNVDPSRPVSDFMTAQPATLDAGATLVEALLAMEAGGYRNLPLVEDGQVVGLLRQHDLLDYIAEAFPQEILNLPPRPHQLMEEPEGA